MNTSNEIGPRQDTHNLSTSAVDMLLAFWRRTWNPPYDLSAIDELLVEHFILTNSGREVKPRAAFKE